MKGLYELLDECPKNKTIADAMVIASAKVRNYDKIACSISGGSDSDILIDMLAKLDPDKKIKYLFINPGLEYEATKKHLKKLEEKYEVEIQKVRPEKPIPVCCKEYGQPFISKIVSKMIQRLQRHHFEWEDDTFENLLKKYCTEVKKEDAFNSNGEKKKKVIEVNGKYYKGCGSALAWWCNENGENSRFNISRNKYLKEFMIKNPPQHKISANCCDKSKKEPIHTFLEENGIELNIYGVRKAEGGIRSSSYKNCFTSKDEIDEYRPLFWMKQDDKVQYEEHYKICHSDCYEKYGLKRTGCVGCPCSLKLKEELDIVEKYEPKLFAAIWNVFGDSYRYTEQYKEFRKELETKEKTKEISKEENGQFTLFEIFPNIMN